MVQQGHADGLVAGVSVNYPEVLRPALRIIGPRPGGRLVAGMFMLVHEHKLYCLADCSVNINPDARDLAEITLMAASELDRLQIVPRIALLSFSNFGSVRSRETEKVAEAVRLVRQERPYLVVDGPVQADVALDLDALREHFPFTELKGRPNLLIFPNLDAGNIALKLLEKFSATHSYGPIMMGMAKPVHLVVRGSDVSTIVNLTAIACVDAQTVARREQQLREAINFAT
jgi:malate dehydrogenase (oxaloacetate-decarboxylating)(NADP+)